MIYKNLVLLPIFLISSVFVYSQTENETIEWLKIKGNKIISTQNNCHSYCHMKFDDSKITYYTTSAPDPKGISSLVMDYKYEIDFTKIHKIYISSHFYCKSGHTIRIDYKTKSLKRYSRVNQGTPHEEYVEFVLLGNSSSKEELERVMKAIKHIGKMKGAKIDETYKEDRF